MIEHWNSAWQHFWWTEGDFRPTETHSSCDFQQRECSGRRGKWLGSDYLFSNGLQNHLMEAILSEMKKWLGKPPEWSQKTRDLRRREPCSHPQLLCRNSPCAVCLWKKCPTLAWKQGGKQHSESPSRLNGNAFKVVLMMCNTAICRSMVTAFFSLPPLCYRQQIVTHRLNN